MLKVDLPCVAGVATCSCGWHVPCGNGVTHLCRADGVPAPPAPPIVPGPGTHLASLLGRLGLSETPGCKCRSYSAQMDRLGVDGCTDRILEIVGWLRTEAQNRGLPFVDFVGRVLVNRAIANARRSLADAAKTAAAQGPDSRLG